MGITLRCFSTAPGDLRTWITLRLPIWWKAWAQSSAEIGLPISPIRAVGKADLDHLVDTVNHLRPLCREPRLSKPGVIKYFESDRPTRRIFQLAHQILLTGRWEIRPKEADPLVQHILRDTDYRLRYLEPDDTIAALLTPLQPAHILGDDMRFKWHQFPRNNELPAKSSPELRYLWSRIHKGRTLAVLPPKKPQPPTDDCTPDHNDCIYGWFNEADCKVLIQALAEIEDAPLTIPPYHPHEDGTFAWIREVAQEALLLGGGMGFFTG